MVTIFLLGWSVLAGSLWRQAHRSATTVVERTRNFYGVLAVHKVDPSNSGLFGMELAHDSHAGKPRPDKLNAG